MRTICYIAVIGILGMPALPHAQQSPNGSATTTRPLSSLFPATDPVAVDLAGDRESALTWLRPSPALARTDTMAVDDDVNAASVVALSLVGTFGGDVIGLALGVWCFWELCDNEAEGWVVVVGASALAVGTSAAGAISGGGDAKGAFVGSAVGLASGWLATDWDDDFPLLIVIHTTMTALGALVWR